jgi:hypothetical protein
MISFRCLFTRTGLCGRVLLLCGLYSLGTAALGQEGHPMTGTWQGYWGNTPDERNFINLNLQWDGDNITGEVNPGPFVGTVREIRLDTGTWTAYFDLQVRDFRSGLPVNLAVEASMYNLGSPARMLKGRLLDGGETSYFTITRE